MKEIEVQDFSHFKRIRKGYKKQVPKKGIEDESISSKQDTKDLSHMKCLMCH